jgi:hypothetical protein
MTTTETTAPAAPAKWNAEQLGPRQAKLVNEALSNFRREAQSYTELTGTHGKPETEKRWSYVAVMGAGRSDAAARLEAVKAQFLDLSGIPTITPKNYQAVIAAIDAARREMEKSRPTEDKRITLEEEAARMARAEASNREREEREAAVAVSKAWLEAKRPSWAGALIVAEFREDTSDVMTDYHGHKTVRRVAIGWRKGEREDFSQLRAAAGAFEETKHLGPGCDDFRVYAAYTEDLPEDGKHKGDYYPFPKVHGKRFTTRAAAEQAVTEAEAAETLPSFVQLKIGQSSIEHRENYSMGGGNYLGGRDSGWHVSSYNVNGGGDALEDRLPELGAPLQSETGLSTGGVTVSENPERGGVEIKFSAKPSESVLARLKGHGWRWSKFGKCWYKKASPEALAFARSLAGENPAAPADTTTAEAGDKPAAAAAPVAKPKAVQIPRDVIATLDRSRIEGRILFLPDRLDRADYVAVNKVLEILGGKWNRGAKGHVFEMDATDAIESAILTGSVVDARKVFQFFETPESIATLVVELAEITDDCEILEPSAGRGALLDAVLEAHPGILSPITAVDLDPQRMEELGAKYASTGRAYVHGSDFLTVSFSHAVKFDRIVMNPPFCNQQDITHVTHAYGMLKPGGVLVSVVGEGAFFRETTKARAFRALLDETDAEIIDLERGAFAKSGTDVKTRLVKIRKPE